MTIKPILQNYKKQNTAHVPIWCMRQAGRYLPEYRELRKNKGGFLDMVYDPEAASEVTLQPIRRYHMDGAILVSDILVIPQALGPPLSFEAGEGPKLTPILDEHDIQKLNIDRIDLTLSPVYETVKLVCKKLQAEGFDETALIGFCGGPWTVACYMVEGGGSKDFAHVKLLAAGNPKGFQKLIDIVTHASIEYLTKQIEFGCEAVQIFESWAGLLDEEFFDQFVIKPTRKIVAAIKGTYPDIPVIGFPRGAGYLIETYALKTGIDAVGLDYTVPLNEAKKLQAAGLCVQGNLDPARLLAGGEALDKGARAILDALSDKPFVFNLGHGVIKDTPPEHMARLAEIVKGFKS